MFTGIIEEVGIVQGLKVDSKASKIIVKADKVLENTQLGDSISTNGVCLTVTNLEKTYFEADIMAETFRRSNLGSLKIGSKINLERALTLQSRLGGHMVSGHIDGTGKIVSVDKEEIATWITIEAEENLLRYIIEKGSIAIDGISLTVAYVDNQVFKVSIIPHTGEETTLLNKKIGDVVNLECDMVGKYVEKLLGIQNQNGQKNSKINEDFLKSNGFI